MLDAAVRRLLERPLARAGRWAAAHVSADLVTWTGFALGIAGAGLVAADWAPVGLGFFLLARIADGLDGAIARERGPTMLGAFLDVALDLIVYIALGFAFAIRAPESSLTSLFFVGAFAILMTTELSFRYFARQPVPSPPLIGHTETSIMLAAACAYPPVFPTLAYIFGALCFVATGMRIVTAIDHFKSAER